MEAGISALDFQEQRVDALTIKDDFYVGLLTVLLQDSGYLKLNLHGFARRTKSSECFFAKVYRF